MDTESAINPIENARAIEIALLKTASYSTIAPIKIGAALAHASEYTRESLEDYGKALGVAFQMTDDLLGLFGDQQVTGKSVTTDITEGKATYLMQQALVRTTGVERRKLKALIGRSNLRAYDVETVRTIVVKCGARTATEDIVKEYMARAIRALDKLELAQQARQELEEIVVAATRRQV